MDQVQFNAYAMICHSSCEGQRMKQLQDSPYNRLVGVDQAL